MHRVISRQEEKTQNHLFSIKEEGLIGRYPPANWACFALPHDDRIFYGIFSISNKLTKTGPNTKENLQNRRKASRQST
jgi:hypothetical protein